MERRKEVEEFGRQIEGEKKYTSEEFNRVGEVGGTHFLYDHPL